MQSAGSIRSKTNVAFLELKNKPKLTNVTSFDMSQCCHFVMCKAAMGGFCFFGFSSKLLRILIQFLLKLLRYSQQEHFFVWKLIVSDYGFRDI